MKVALFKDVKWGFISTMNADEGGSFSFDNHPDYVRISETVEVDFPMLNINQVIDRQIACIDKQITNARAECERHVTALERQKQELLALPCHPEQ